MLVRVALRQARPSHRPHALRLRLRRRGGPLDVVAAQDAQRLQRALRRALQGADADAARDARVRRAIKLAPTSWIDWSFTSRDLMFEVRHDERREILFDNDVAAVEVDAAHDDERVTPRGPHAPDHESTGGSTSTSKRSTRSQTAPTTASGASPAPRREADRRRRAACRARAARGGAPAELPPEIEARLARPPTSAPPRKASASVAAVARRKAERRSRQPRRRRRPCVPRSAHASLPSTRQTPPPLLRDYQDAATGASTSGVACASEEPCARRRASVQGEQDRGARSEPRSALVGLEGGREERWRRRVRLLLPRQAARLPRCSSSRRPRTSLSSSPTTYARGRASSPRRPSPPGDRRTLSGTASRSRAMSAPRAAIRRCSRPAGSQTCPWPLQIRSARRRPSRYRRRRKQRRRRVRAVAASLRSSRLLQQCRRRRDTERRRGGRGRGS